MAYIGLGASSGGLNRGALGNGAEAQHRRSDKDLNTSPVFFFFANYSVYRPLGQPLVDMSSPEWSSSLARLSCQPTMAPPREAPGFLPPVVYDDDTPG